MKVTVAILTIASVVGFVGLAGAQWAPAPSPAVNPQSLEEVHGKIVSLAPPILTIKADDGRTVQVNVGRYADALRYSLRKNQGVTITGLYEHDRNHMVARYVKSDESDTTVDGLLAVPPVESNESPSASPPMK
jgi:hypothetical protein